MTVTAEQRISMQHMEHVSRHALKRLNKRTQLSCEEIARILDKRLCVNIGSKPGIGKDHFLFYSLPDDDFFVAIQDRLDGTVITVLTLEYHANLAWTVTDQDCTKARDIFLNPPTQESAGQLGGSPCVLVISGHYIDSEGHQKTKSIFKTPSAPYQNDLKNIMEDEGFFTRLHEGAVAKGIDPWKMYGISIRYGKKSKATYFDLCDIHAWTPRSLRTH